MEAINNELTHYERLRRYLDQGAVDRAIELANQCRPGANNYSVEPLVDHVAQMLYGAQQKADQDPGRVWKWMFRQSMVLFWSTVQVAKQMTIDTMPYRYRGAAELRYDQFVKCSALSNDPEGLNMQAQLCWHLAMHELCDHKVYQVSPGLALNLSLTELRGITTDLLHLPFEAVYVQVPKAAGLFVHNADTGWHCCEGIYVVEDPDDWDGHRCWRIMAVGASKPHDDKTKDQFLFENDALVHFRISLPVGARLVDVIDQAGREMRADMDEVATGFVGMIDEWPLVFRWLMNVVIYCTWPDSEPEDVWANNEARKLWAKIQRGPSNAKHARKARRKLQAIERRRRTVLGRPIVIDRSLPVREDPGVSTGRELAVRQRVQGHLKRVRHGPGRQEVKVVRIDPYWRGSEAGEVTNGPRRLK